MRRSAAISDENNEAKKKAAREKSNQNILPFRFKPGQSGNPNGRPKRRPLTSRYEKALEKVISDEDCKRLGLDKGSTVADAITANLIALGLSGGKEAIMAAKEFREPIEGKAVQRLAGPDGEALVPPALTVNFVKRTKK